MLPKNKISSGCVLLHVLAKCVVTIMTHDETGPQTFVRLHLLMLFALESFSRGHGPGKFEARAFLPI